METVKMCKRGNVFKFACVLFEIDSKAALVEVKKIKHEGVLIEVGASVNVKWDDEWLRADVLFLNSKYLIYLFIFILFPYTY